MSECHCTGICLYWQIKYDDDDDDVLFVILLSRTGIFKTSSNVHLVRLPRDAVVYVTMWHQVTDMPQADITFQWYTMIFP